MGTAIVVTGIVLLILAGVVFLLSRLGRFIAHSDQRVYIRSVLSAVETRGQLDMQDRAWYR